MNEQCAKIEAILFACGEPVGFEKIAEFLKISKGEAKEFTKMLKSFYENNKTGLQIITKANTIQLVSNGKFGKDIADFLNKSINEPLTRVALEVLSIIAYRGPMTRSEIEHIRGVNCNFMLRNLAIRGLIEKEESVSNTRSYKYSISYDFLKSMGLEDIRQLPDYQSLSKVEKEKEERFKGTSANEAEN